MTNPFCKLDDPLSKQESKVIHLITSGLSNKEIGSILNVSESCVKHHVGAIMIKTGIHNRVLLAVGMVKGEINV